jgi:hypothetical protein
MPLLPFLQAPKQHAPRKVGNANSGILEIPVYGGLTVGESATITELVASEQSAFVRGAQIADAIAKEEDISLMEAFNLIENAISGVALEEAAEQLRLKHAERIADVARVYAASGRRHQDASVTAILQSRLGLSDWTLTDTQKLDGALFADIWQLVQDEQDAEGRTSEPPSEAELKKPLPEPGNPSKRTGRKSPSSCSTDTPASSAETASTPNCAL